MTTIAMIGGLVVIDNDIFVHFFSINNEQL